MNFIMNCVIFFLSPTEKTWTYKCLNNRCIRHHFLGEYTDEKRMPYITCTMKCGPLQIWPQPTIKTTLGSSSLNFKLDDLHLKLGSSFDNVNNLIKDAFVIFRREIKVLENSSSNNYNNNNNNNRNSNLRDKERTKFDVINDNVFNNDENERKSGGIDTTIFGIRNKQRHHDLEEVLVYIHVKKSIDIHLTLDTDESYNLTLTRKYYIRLKKKSDN
jgi:beta-hexosaminidase Fdl